VNYWLAGLIREQDPCNAFHSVGTHFRRRGDASNSLSADFVEAKASTTTPEVQIILSRRHRTGWQQRRKAVKDDTWKSTDGTRRMSSTHVLQTLTARRVRGRSALGRRWRAGPSGCGSVAPTDGRWRRPTTLRLAVLTRATIPTTMARLVMRRHRRRIWLRVSGLDETMWNGDDSAAPEPRKHSNVSGSGSGHWTNTWPKGYHQG